MPTMTSPATAIVGAVRPTATSSCPPSTAAPPLGSPASQPSRADPPEKEGVEVGERKEIKSPSTVMDGVVDRPVTDLQKKVRRAERFGMAVVLSEQEKRNSRAERFGTGSPLHGATIRNLEQQKRKARAERFGLAAQPVTDVEAKKKARLERFAQNSKPFTSEEEKRKARAARFSQTSTASSATNEKVQKNVVANVSEGTGKIVGTAR